MPGSIYQTEKIGNLKLYAAQHTEHLSMGRNARVFIVTLSGSQVFPVCSVHPTYSTFSADFAPNNFSVGSVNTPAQRGLRTQKVGKMRASHCTTEKAYRDERFDICFRVPFGPGR